jgi:simple sugar transport system permease protein
VIGKLQWQPLLKHLRSFGVPRLVLVGFLSTLFILSLFTEISITQLISDSLTRVGRNGILVLALLPGIKSGIRLNFGLSIGILCGLVALALVMEFNGTGWDGFFIALILSVLFSAGAGFFYGLLLNRVKGEEMVVGTYMGFALVSLFCLLWSVAPFKNPQLIWAIGGEGLRTTCSLDNYFSQILDRSLMFTLGEITVPLGLLLTWAIACVLIWLFFNTKLGIAMKSAGLNEKCARACGINSQKTRVQGTMLSTILAGVGIVVYSQSFGFVQFYTAPLLMAFPIIACILIGGADATHASIFNVIIGTIIFQTLLVIALPIASQFIEGDISQVAQVIISNGIILCALVGIKAKT